MCKYAGGFYHLFFFVMYFSSKTYTPFSPVNINPFVFSNKLNYKLARHATFWFTWILYYSLISAIDFAPSFGFVKSFTECFIEVALSTPLDMCFCYFILYFLFPKFFFNGKYIQMLLLWLIVSIVFIAAFEVNRITVVPVIRQWFDMPVPLPRKSYVWAFFTLFSQINMEGCIAASIRLGKLWVVKQQEIDLLKQDKEKTQPQDDKQLMNPGFLSDLLLRIETLADSKPLLVAQSIKKLRPLINVMLYDNSRPKVLLKNELSLLQEYIYLEQIAANDRVLVETNINAYAGTETIAPFIILPVVENAFRQIHHQPLTGKKIKIDVSLNDNILHVGLAWSKPVDTSTLINGRQVILQNISKRLQLIYPKSHELKIFIEMEKVRVDLKVDLRKAIN